jgi:hypothetical protein
MLRGNSRARIRVHLGRRLMVATTIKASEEWNEPKSVKAKKFLFPVNLSKLKKQGTLA